MTAPVWIVSLTIAIGVAASWAGRTSWSSTVLDRVVGGGGGPVVPEWFVSVLRRFELAGDPARWWRAATVAVVPSGLLLFVWSPILLVVGAGACGVVLVRARRASGRAPDVVVVIEALLSPLAAGASLSAAIDRVVDQGGPPAEVLVPVGLAVRGGASVQQALDGWAADSADDGARLVADAVAVAGTTGGSIAGALLGAGDTVRERHALDRELRALGSQARASAVVLVVVPIVFTALVAVADSRVAAFLFTTPGGLVCLGAGLAADAIGWMWMQRLIGSVA